MNGADKYKHMSYLIIKKSAATAGLRTISSTDEDVEVMSFSGANINSAADILAEIDDENWTLTSSYVEVNGEDSTDIRVPKKAITG